MSNSYLNLDWELVYKDYQLGLSSRKLAKKYKVCQRTILQNLHKRNYKLLSSKEATPHLNIDWFGVYKEYLTGISIDELGKKYNCSGSVIKHQFRKNNLKTRTVKECNSSRKGDKHPNWQGGITKKFCSIKQQLRADIHMKMWRKAVFDRDNYTCQDCYKTNCYLEAHHKYPLRKILQDFDIVLLAEALNCKELWDINNGITLCQECHLKYKLKS